MSADQESTTISRRRRRNRTLVLATALLCVLGVAGAIAYNTYSNPERIRSVAESYLQRFTPQRVTVGSATFSFLEGVRLYNVAVANSPTTPNVPGSSTPIFFAEEIRLEYDPWQAMRGRLAIQSLLALSPTFTIVHDAATQTTNLSDFLRPGDLLQHNRDLKSPTIELRDARVRVLSVEPEGLRPVEDLHVTIRARPDPSNPYVYDVVWRSSIDNTQGHSRIDLETGQIRNVQGGLPAMSIEAVMLAINAKYDGAGALRDLLGLSGTVRATDYDLVTTAEPGDTRSATIELLSASVSVPINSDEAELAPDQRYLRFEDVDGTIELHAEQIRASFTGSFHGSVCNVTVTLRGGDGKWTSLDDVDFEAQLSVEHLTLPQGNGDAPPDERRFVHAWPQLTRFYERYSPTGPVDVDIHVIKRAGPHEKLNLLHALVTAKGGSASFHRYPYRGDGLTGTVEFTPERITIHDLCGHRAGGTICVAGHFDTSSQSAPASVTVSATAVPVDDDLYRALGSRYAGLRERFAPEGKIGLHISMIRTPGEGDPAKNWTTRTTVTFDDLNATYSHFPYPLEHLAGSLLIKRHHVDLLGVTGQAGTGNFRLAGSIEFADRGIVSDIDLRVSAKSVSFDQKLYDALPPEFASQLATLNPDGTFNVETTLTKGHGDTDIDQRSTVNLNGASMRHEAFPIRLTDIIGRVDLRPGEITLSDISARYRGAAISADGTLTSGIAPELKLTLGCRNLSLDDDLIAASPLRLREALTTWRVDGPIAADVFLTTDPKSSDGTLTYRAEVTLNDVTVSHSMFPIPFEHVNANLVLDDSGVHSDDVTADYAGASIHATIHTETTTNAEKGTITVTATGVVLGDALRGILSPNAQSTWDRIKPRGKIDATLEELEFQRPVGGGPTQWYLKGSVTLNDVSLDGVAQSEHLSGSVTITGAIADRSGGTILSGNLHLDTAHILDRRITDATGAWTFARSALGHGRLAFTDFVASLYDGRLTANSEILFGPDGAKYNMTALVHDVQLAPFIHAGADPSAPHSTDDPHLGVRGRLHANLYLSGDIDDRTSRKGGGRLELVDGFIHRLPIIMAIFNVLDLSLPGDQAFEDAETAFFVVGDRVQLDDIVLRGGVLALVGSGTVRLPELALDLRLVNVTAEGYTRLLIFTDVIEAVSKELVELRVTGPLSQPTVTPYPLPRISDELRRLFQRKKPRKVTAPGS
ncbi:MAG: hypothetical protein IID35_00790 [Planctomycetes bacterium]|nr:hypothetical protein [Planctomycetota bacterium]